MTLTTERQQFEEWAKGEGFSLARGIPVGCGNCIYVDGDTYILWQAWQASREILANREAQTAACDIERIKRHALPAGECPRQSQVVLLSSLKRLLTAPPAPAVPPEATPENIENLLADITLFFTAGSLSHGGAVMFAEVWNACRAAMLAQPVSQSYTLNSPEIPDGCQWTYDEQDYKWDSGCGEAWMFSDGGPVENGVKFCQGCGKPVLLAAEPEGGNG
ncbi:hypothetical protein PTR34_23940 [Serratia nevei]|uniref:hypothetical protein n=1 Tax=Serratia nevei TaxID=2703794 RepID=UPI00313DACDE